MRRSSRSKPTDRISLFPFLAVLICTMGALLVLLVVMSQHAQAKATQEHTEQAKEDQADAVRDLEDLQMWITQWEAMKANTEKDLARRRAELTHIEDHMRRLKAKIDELKAAHAQLARDADESLQTEELQRELQRIQAELAEANRKLAEEKQRAKKQVSYAVIPYEGPNHTRRRPIYLECRPDAVILQPEGIRLEERDFMSPLGPANPLVSAIRAASAYWTGLAAEGHDVGQPYPLLLVRADGIEAYYAARSAMKSWESEFGYELIGNDLELEFPTPEARLADAAQQAVDAARRRRARRGSGGRGGSGGPGGRGRLGPGGEADTPFGLRRAKSGGLGQRDPEDSAPSDGNLPNNLGHERPPSEQGDSHADQVGARNPGGAASASPPSAGGGGAQGANPQSISESRGKDWASPSASKGLIPFTRTMSIQVAADRMIIVSQDPTVAPTTVVFSGSTKEGVEEFVSKVWEEMKSWGSAGRGMYWRPELNLRVLPGGQRRAQELQVLMSDSGLEVVPPASAENRYR